MADDIETRTKVTILTATYRIKGYIDLVPGARVTAYSNDARDTIAITDAEVREAEGTTGLQGPCPKLDRGRCRSVTPGRWTPWDARGPPRAAAATSSAPE